MKILVSGSAVTVLAVAALLTVKTVDAADSAASVPITFSKDVAPIFQQRCEECHRPGGMAPMSLRTFEDVRPWARAIRARVAAREMPPWFLNKEVGIREYKDDYSLSDQQIDTILKWVDGGLLQGNAADLPKPRTFPNEASWAIGAPDLVISMDKAYNVPAVAKDAIKDFVVDPHLTEDRYIKAIEMKPGNARVVHHARAYMMLDEATPPGADVDLTSEGPGEGTFLAEYAVGKNGDLFAPETGRLLKAGSKIRFSIHYSSVGEAIADQTKVGFVFYPKGAAPKYHVLAHLMGDNDINGVSLPAGATNVRNDAYWILERPALILGFQPHMHMRGVAEDFEVIHLDGRPELLTSARFDFRWHIMYSYADYVAPLLPKGSVLHITTYHDNSAANRNNPDPTQWIGYGPRSIDDMHNAWINYIYLDEADYQRMAAERKAARGTRNQ